MSTSSRRTRASACSAIPCASSTARMRATRRSTPARRPSPIISTRRAATSSRRWRPAAETKALGIARALRRAGIAVEQDYRGNMKRRMQRANKLNARAAIILGDDELAKGVAQLKDLDSGEQREVALDKLVEALR